MERAGGFLADYLVEHEPLGTAGLCNFFLKLFMSLF